MLSILHPAHAQVITVPAGIAADTLTLLAREAHVSVMWDPNEIEVNQPTHPVENETDIESALQKMLTGTSLNFVLFPWHYVWISKKPDPKMAVVVCIRHGTMCAKSRVKDRSIRLP